VEPKKIPSIIKPVEGPACSPPRAAEPWHINFSLGTTRADVVTASVTLLEVWTSHQILKWILCLWMSLILKWIAADI
jgi:hypothetical protein